jgi:hypothetical protein
MPGLSSMHTTTFFFFVHKNIVQVSNANFWTEMTRAKGHFWVAQFSISSKYKTRRPFLVGGFVVIDLWMKARFCFCKTLICFSQAWRRPSLPRLKTKYHWRWSDLTPRSRWGEARWCKVPANHAGGMI